MSYFMVILDPQKTIPFYARTNISASPSDDGRSYWAMWQRKSARTSRLFFPRNNAVHLELTRKAYYVLRALGAGEQVIPGSICIDYNTTNPSSELRHAEVQEAVSLLYAYGFLVPTRQAVALGYKVIEPEGQARALPIWRKLLSLRVPLINPDRMLGWIDARFGKVLFSRTFHVFMAIWIVFVLGSVFAHHDRLQEQWGTLYAYYLPTNLPLIYFWLFVGKLFHELGHGLVIKHLGREVPELGIQLIFLTPFPYCESQNARGLSRRAEMLIAGVGVYAEIMLASVFGFLWLNSEYHEISYLYMTMMLTLGVNTLLFNGNPLTLFDSYHVLSHAMGHSEHLRERAFYALDQSASRLFFGVERKLREETKHWFLPWYGCAVFVYRFFLVFGICSFLAHALEPYGLGFFFGALATWSLILVPGARILRWIARGFYQMMGFDVPQAPLPREEEREVDGLDALGLT